MAKPDRDVLVVVFLRGGVDGLHAVCPHADPHYRSARGRLQLPSPGQAEGVVDLDGFFGLHPHLAQLKTHFDDKSLAIIHACGNPGGNLSHFSDMLSMERGVTSPDGARTGWLARHLLTSRALPNGFLRAVAIDDKMPPSLEGAGAAVVAVPDLAAYRVPTPEGWGNAYAAGLDCLYAGAAGTVAEAGRETLRLARLLPELGAGEYSTENGAQYDYRVGAAYEFGPLARGMRQVARLIKADIGLEIAEVDLLGWDTHAEQANALVPLMVQLGHVLHNFARDLGDRMANVTVVAMTEFGRRAAGNSSGGTDHGKGSVMFLLGGGVRGGQVYGAWPGLSADELDSLGNVRITTDYRSVLAELLQQRLGSSALTEVFPGFQASPLGVFHRRALASSQREPAIGRQGGDSTRGTPV